jgi:hypothetical protein
MVFEDDAVLDKTFGDTVRRLSYPNNFDFTAFYLPYNRSVPHKPFRFVRCYQEHGQVCNTYSPKGARKILHYLQDFGLDWPVDIWLYKQARGSRLKGYSPNLDSKEIVTVDYRVPSNIHDDDRIAVHHPGEV